MNANSNQPTGAFGNPWLQLTIGVICMACVANLQYGWTLFVTPIDDKYHWGRAAIQVAFTVFVLVETWLIPVEGYLVDRFGPRWVVIGGAFLVAIAWVINSGASSLPVLYFAAAVGGIGTGCVYGTCVGNALKWFPGRRGLAAGITAAGFGAGAAHHDRAHRLDDPIFRLRAGLPGVWPGPGCHRVRHGLGHGGRSAVVDRCQGKSEPDCARLHARRGACATLCSGSCT